MDQTLCRGLFCFPVKLESADRMRTADKKFARPESISYWP